MKHRRLPAALLALVLCLTMYACPALPEAADAPDYDEVYLRSGQAVFLPDVPVPGRRIVPMDEVPAGAVTYRVDVSTENLLP